ncbi:MAG: RNA polymerase sigma factor [Acidimicrobiia bacterium]
MSVRETGWEDVLVPRLIAGDERALAEAYERYGSFVFGLARRITGDAGAAQDITQEVFVRLWERPTGFDVGRGTLRSYLGVITHRRSVDWVRREASRTRREERDQNEARGVVVDVADAATAGVISQHVRSAVETLPADQRRAVELAYFAGHTYREVATLLGVAEGTAKGRLRLALTKLADALRAEGLVAGA